LRARTFLNSEVRRGVGHVCEFDVISATCPIVIRMLDIASIYTNKMKDTLAIMA